MHTASPTSQNAKPVRTTSFSFLFIHFFNRSRAIQTAYASTVGVPSSGALRNSLLAFISKDINDRRLVREEDVTTRRTFRSLLIF